MKRLNKINIFMIPFIFIFFINYAFSDVRGDIYSKLKCCACYVSFDKCACPEAKEMKAYIDALLESGITKEEIFYKAAKKFSLNAILDIQIKAEIEKRLIKETGKKRPQIIIEPPSFNFGEVSKKQGKVSKIFRLSNKGNSPLIIKKLKTFCPCASVSLKANKAKSPYFGTEGSPQDWQVEIRPQEKTELEVIVDLASPHIKPGKLIRDTSVTSNDPLYPEITVRVEAEVRD